VREAGPPGDDDLSHRDAKGDPLAAPWTPALHEPSVNRGDRWAVGWAVVVRGQVVQVGASERSHLS